MHTYKLAADVLSVDMTEESILLSYGAGRYFGIKGAVRHLLEKLHDGMSLDDMTAVICSHYDVSRIDAAHDLEEILPKLVRAGLIEQSA